MTRENVVKAPLQPQEISTRQLGAIICSKHVYQLLTAQGWHNFDFINNKDGMEVLYSSIDVDEADLFKLVQNLSSTNYELRPIERSVKVTENRTTYILRSPSKDWSAIDPTVPVLDDQKRYDFGTTLEKNSSWLDICIVIGIQMDAGRTRQDQILPSETRKLSRSCLYFREMLSFMKWGGFTQTERDLWRGNLRDMLAQDPHGIASPQEIRDNPCAADLAIKALFHNLPQTSFTQIESYMCCDAKLVAEDRQPQRKCCLTIGFVDSLLNVSLGTQINLQLVKPKRYSSICSRGADCVGIGQKHTLILDQLPPLLIVITINVSINQHNEHIWKPFDRTVITYMSARSLDFISHNYDVVGAIFQHEETKQYSVHWRHSKRRAQFDNSSSYGAEVQWDNQNLQFPDIYETVVALFYRRVMS